MTITAIAAGFASWLGSAAGQAATQELLTRLHPEERVNAAINSLPTLVRPAPRRTALLNSLDGGNMADTKFQVAVVNASGTPAKVGLDFQEIAVLFSGLLEVYSLGKDAYQARPAEEPTWEKVTWAAEVGFPRAMSLLRQGVRDFKD